MAEKQNTPEIRFEGFTDPWEQRKLGEVGEIYTGNTPATDNPIYYSNNGIPWITPSDIVDFDTPKPAKYLSEVGLKVGRTVPAGSIMCTCIASIGKNTITSTTCGFNQQINALVPNKEQYDSNFLFAESYLWSQTMKRDAAAGTMQIVNKSEFSELNILKPSLIEQQAIGSFFSRLDHLITLHQRKYDKLCTVKKSMLDKMFPKPGEIEPEIRFEGFTDPWEQRKLSSIAASFDYGLNAAATEYDGKNKYLRITDIDDATHEFLKSDLTTPLADLAMSADYLLEEGDLLFARTGASVGKTYLYRQYDGTVYFAGFLIRARIEESADPEFVYQATLTDAYKKFVAITSQRSGQPGVNAQEYADYQLMLPSRTEQQQIGMTLRSLDNLITLHQRKLDLLMNTKKSLLDKMFV